jgi:hypothetical protein
MICNKFNEKNVKEIARSFDVLSMIDKHIIFVESKINVFNDATFFNTNASSCKWDVLMNLKKLDAWYNNINNTIYAASYVDIC